MFRVSFAMLAAVGGLLALSPAGLADTGTCLKAYPRGDLYRKVTTSLQGGDCPCARLLFTEFGRENLEHIEAERSFFDEINHEIFRCEIEFGQAGLAAGDTERSVRGLGR